MIQLIPFYLSLNAPIHSIKDRDVTSRDQNLKMSLSLLNSILPTLIEYLTEFEDKSIVIVCPSAKEGGIVSSRLNRWFVDNRPQYKHRVHWHDPFHMHRRIADEPGIHVICYQNLIKNVISCDIAVNYYPMGVADVREVYRRARTLALFDPMNKTSNYYAAYIRMLTDKKTGVKK